jgi:acyl-CoA synthetase (AMP-forming)/AMP-acid ligase II
VAHGQPCAGITVEFARAGSACPEGAERRATTSILEEEYMQPGLWPTNEYLVVTRAGQRSALYRTTSNITFTPDEAADVVHDSGAEVLLRRRPGDITASLQGHPMLDIGAIWFSAPEGGPVPNRIELRDLGRVNADGFPYMTRRRSHAVITGGIRVAPTEVEDVLLTHRAVADGLPREKSRKRRWSALADTLQRHGVCAVMGGQG